MGADDKPIHSFNPSDQVLLMLEWLRGDVHTVREEVQGMRRDINGRIGKLEGRTDALEADRDRGYYPRLVGRTMLVQGSKLLASALGGGLLVYFATRI